MDLPIDFSQYFVTEIDIQKSYNDSGEGKRYIFGVASTQTRDEDGEVILQKFVDLEPFVERGFFNYEHQKEPDYIIGFPYKEECYVNDQGVYVAGELFRGHPMADKVWDLITYMKKNAIPRRLYFSIEGKAYRFLSDPPGLIRSFRVYDVAITKRPANPQAVMDFALKSVQVDGSPALYIINPHEMVSGHSALRREVVDDTLRVITYLLKNRDGILEELRSKKNLSKEEAIIYTLLNSESITKVLDLYGGVSN